MKIVTAPAGAALVLACASVPLAMDAVAGGFNPMNMMNPSKWMGGKNGDRYYDDDYYDRRYGYGGPYGYGGGPYGYGGGPYGYGAGPYGYGWGGYPGGGYGGYPGYGYGAPQGQQQQQAPTPPPIQ